MLSNFNCGPEEEITALTAYSPMVNGKAMSLFCLGTYIYEAEEKEPTNGRLLIFTAYQSESPSNTSSLQLSMVASADVKGCVYALTVVGDTVVAAVNSAVSNVHMSITALLRLTFSKGEDVSSQDRGGSGSPVFLGIAVGVESQLPRDESGLLR